MLFGCRRSIVQALVLVVAAGAMLAATSALAQRGRMPRPVPSPVPPAPSLMPPDLNSPGLDMPMPLSPSQVMPDFLPAPVPVPKHSGVSNEKLAVLYKQIVKLYETGKYGEAMPPAKQYVKAIKTRVGDDDPSYAAAINLLAMIEQGQGQYAEAEAHVKRALAIHEHQSGSQHPDVAIDLNLLGQLYHEQGRFDEAERMLKRALTINEKSFGLKHLNVSRDLNNLAWLYQAQGRYAEAEPHVKRALAIVEKELGPEDADVGRVLDTLAKVYEGQGRVKDAEPIYKRALAILEKSLGIDHPGVAVTRENLGGLYKSLGQAGVAELLLKSALSIKKRVFGADHPSVARSLVLLGDLYRMEGRSGEAESLFLRALAIRKAGIREVPVFYATDRKPTKNAKMVVFGGERSHSLTFGRADVIVPKPASMSGHARYAVSQAKVKMPVPGFMTDYARVAMGLPDHVAAPATLQIETTEIARLSIRQIDVVSNERQFMEAVQKRLDASKIFPKHVFIFVHGYNVSFENALRRTAQIAYDLNFDGAPFLFSWPSSSSLVSYWSDRASAKVAVNHLKKFLEKIVAETNATKIHLIAHSMGNVVLLDALEKIKLSHGDRSRQTFAEVVLHAPDVDKDRFRQLMKAIKGLGGKVTLYVSKGDRALGLAGWFWGFMRVGMTPTVVKGVETIDVTAAGSSLLGFNHDLYATNPTIFNDMRLLLERSDHPPDKRSPAFMPVGTKDGMYWLYHQP